MATRKTRWSYSDHTFFYKLYSYTVKLIIATFLMGEFLNMLAFVPSLDIVVEQMNDFLILLLAVFRYMYMRMNESVYKKLAKSMQMSNLDTSTPARKALVKYWMEMSETYFKVLLGLGSLAITAWDVYPLMDDIEYNLNVGLRLGVDFSSPSRYPIAYIISTIALQYSGFIVMVNDVTLQAHLIHLVCQYTVLADCFENIVVDCEKDFKGLRRDQLVRDSRFREVYISRLGLLVEQHKNILIHTMELRKATSLPMLGQLAASGVIICFSGYQVATTSTLSFTKFFMSLLVLGYNLFELFVLCQWCDEIKNQSENIGIALYCSSWECGVGTMPGVRARLMLVFTRASKPLVLTAGGIADLSLESYSDLMFLRSTVQLEPGITMDYLASLWRAISHTKALEDSSGEMETTFFETVYRMTYIAGLSNSDHSFFYKVYSSTVKLIIAAFIMGEAWYLLTIAVSSLDIVVEQTNDLLILGMAVFRYKYMRMHESVYKKLASSMQKSNLDTSTPARKALVEYWMGRGETYLKLMLGLGNVTLAIWYAYPLVDDIEYNLSVGLRLGVDFSSPLRYPIAYTIHVVAFHYSAFFVMVNDAILQAHLIHLSCQYTVLADCFEHILVDCEKNFKGLSRDRLVRDSRFREVYRSRLGLLVEQHKNILMHTMELRKAISLPMLGQMAAASMQICFSGYQVATTLTVSFTKFFMSLMFLGFNLFVLFVVCRWCDEIRIQSDNISYALYCSGWECGVTTMPGVRARLMLAVTRASKPIVLTAGGITDLSLESYYNLVKTSYSALTVLLRVRHE